MSMGCLLTSARQNEALTFGQLVHDGIDLVFQQRDLAFGQMGGRVEGRLRLVGSEIGADVEKAVLYAYHHLVFVAVGWEQRRQESEMRAELIDGTVGL